MTARTHTLGPIAAKTVDAIRIRRAARRNDLSEYVHAVIAVAGEARVALAAYHRGELGGPEGPKLADRLRDILAICEAAGGES